MQFDDIIFLVNRQVTFNEWVSQVLPEESPIDVVAYCFNISETIGQEYAIEVIGASVYDENNSAWPCHETWSGSPSAYYIPFREYGSCWEDAQAGIVSLVKGFLGQTIDRGAQVLLSSRAVAVGFVDGDLILVCPTPRTSDQNR